MYASKRLKKINQLTQQIALLVKIRDGLRIVLSEIQLAPEIREELISYHDDYQKEIDRLMGKLDKVVCRGGFKYEDKQERD